MRTGDWPGAQQVAEPPLGIYFTAACACTVYPPSPMAPPRRGGRRRHDDDHAWAFNPAMWASVVVMLLAGARWRGGIPPRCRLLPDLIGPCSCLLALPPNSPSSPLLPPAVYSTDIAAYFNGPSLDRLRPSEMAPGIVVSSQDRRSRRRLVAVTREGGGIPPFPPPYMPFPRSEECP